MNTHCPKCKHPIGYHQQDPADMMRRYRCVECACDMSPEEIKARPKVLAPPIEGMPFYTPGVFR